MKLHYRKSGQGKPLFILHGLFGMSDNWVTVGKILSPSPTLPIREGEKNISVYLIDLRNHGKSPHSAEWAYSSMANDILELMKEEKLDTINLIGHSLGGKVAMQFASMYPEKLEKLIVVDMSPKDLHPKVFDFVKLLPSIKLAGMKSRKEAEGKLSSIIKEKEVVQLLLKNLYWNDANKLEWKFNLEAIVKNMHTIGNTFSLKEKIEIPALFIRGEKSNYITDKDVHEIKKIFPHSEFKTIKGAGHWVHADKPMEFAKAVRDFC
ncbi:MAG: alpha/beta fold hydrolase [Bacteroidetes bacterium]|nr:alpha/beta fold hydrolase [Bacteroidota bacterium]